MNLPPLGKTWDWTCDQVRHGTVWDPGHFHANDIVRDMAACMKTAFQVLCMGIAAAARPFPARWRNRKHFYQGVGWKMASALNQDARSRYHFFLFIS